MPDSKNCYADLLKQIPICKEQQLEILADSEKFVDTKLNMIKKIEKKTYSNDRVHSTKKIKL